jgi:hypothetical protein
MAAACYSADLALQVPDRSGLDLTPSMHWPAAVIARNVEQERGPVLVTVEYEINPKNRNAFLTALARLCCERRRDIAGLARRPSLRCGASRLLKKRRL